MRYAVLLCVLSMGVSSIAADELILKDGKKIEWKTITDAGDQYEIVTATGANISIKKDDVDRLVRKAIDTPLTGASITFDKKRKLETVDLLSKANPKAALAGTWKLASGAITGTAGPLDISRVPTSFVPPEEYDLYCTIERKDVSGEAFIGLVGGGKQFTFHLDGKGGSWSGLQVVNGDTLNMSNTLGVVGKVFVDKGSPKKLRLMVRKTAFVVQIDGKDFFTWDADWSKLSVHQDFSVPEKNVLFLGARSGSFQFSQISVVEPK